MLADVPHMRITVTHDDGTSADITEGVQIAYDIAYGSMDWGSGFLDTEEMDAVARLAEACRFPSFEDALESVAAAREAEERRQAAAVERDRVERERREAERQARSQLAAEMVAKEPRLATWNDAALARLHALRNAGLA